MQSSFQPNLSLDVAIRPFKFLYIEKDGRKIINVPTLLIQISLNSTSAFQTDIDIAYHNYVRYPIDSQGFE